VKDLLARKEVKFDPEAEGEMLYGGGFGGGEPGGCVGGGGNGGIN